MKKDYLQSSLQEYFSLLDTEQNVSKSDKVVYDVENSKRATNPFNSRSKSLKTLESVNSLKDMAIKSKYSIDKNRELYLVNTEGVSAIIGKNNTDMRVLKKFDEIVKSPLQVRHDEKNVYMVKTGKYKSLVDISDNEMGVLLEI